MIPSTPIDPLNLYTFITGGQCRSVAVAFAAEPVNSGNPFAVGDEPIYPIVWNGEVFNLKMKQSGDREYDRQQQGGVEPPLYTCLLPINAPIEPGQWVFARRMGDALAFKGVASIVDRKLSGFTRLTIDLSSNVPVPIEVAMPYLNLENVPAPPPPSGTYDLFFQQSDLVAGGILTVDHNLDTFPSSVSVTDNEGMTVNIDEVENVTTNRLLAHMETFVPIEGQWKISLGV